MKSILAPLTSIVLLCHLAGAEAVPIDHVLANYTWVPRACSMPPAAPPGKVDTEDPETPKKRIQLRSLVDSDGDGVCEVYDILPQEVSAFTGMNYGYAMRVSRFENGRWETNHGSVGGWVPVVLESLGTKSRVIVQLNFGGNAGHATRVGFIKTTSSCEEEQLLIAASALLLVSPPPELRTDPALSEEWTGPVRYVVTERLVHGRFDGRYEGELAECMAPFKRVTEFLKAQK